MKENTKELRKESTEQSEKMNGNQIQASVQENKMGVMPINKLLISMSVPLMISMLVQALYNIVDSMFVARICEDALTAVSLAFPMQNLMLAVATGTGVGVNALISRRLGQKQFEEANKTANNAIFLAVCSYLVFLCIGLFGTEAFLRAQTDIESIVSFGTSYLRIICILCFGMFGQIIMERLLQSTGRTMYTMITQLLGAVINIILDPILIFGIGPFPELGVAGAAYATISGQIAAMVLALIFNIKINEEITIAPRYMKPNLQIIRQVYAIGIPSILMVSISSIMTFAMNKILIQFTSTATAVFGAYFKLQSFVFMPLFGMNNGMVPIIGYNFGAGKKERILKTHKTALSYSCIFMWGGFAVFQLIPGKLLGLFSASQNMLDIGIPALRWISLAFLVAGYSVVTISVFQALGKSIYSLIISVARQLVVLLPVAYVMSLTGKLNLVWTSVPIAEAVSVVVTFIMFMNVRKKLDMMMEQVNRNVKR